ncbi:hypothetical protein [Paracidovorax cattleyae]|uniref:hypothetical protein n=1 Tax=Paracidovorax cattleyae TaxID=80868 RepID=UPI0018AF7011|nr:hypothetical protein [Paracidovorax cattleyae]MBF9263393.1 hypothetical protein [Paracidovorax cattleyae]
MTTATTPSNSKKGADVNHTNAQAAQAAASGPAEQPSAVPGSAADAGAVPAVADAPASAAQEQPVHNPKRGGLYRQDAVGEVQPIHRTLHPDDPAAPEALRSAGQVAG